MKSTGRFAREGSIISPTCYYNRVANQPATRASDLAKRAMDGTMHIALDRKFNFWERAKSYTCSPDRELHLSKARRPNARGRVATPFQKSKLIGAQAPGNMARLSFSATLFIDRRTSCA